MFESSSLVTWYMKFDIVNEVNLICGLNPSNIEHLVKELKGLYQKLKNYDLLPKSIEFAVQTV